MRRFIVALNSSTPAQNAAFKQFINDNRYGWWHWLKDLWLLTDSTETLTASALRDELSKIYPGVHLMVFELHGKNDTWSGFGPKTGEKNMFRWIKENW